MKSTINKILNTTTEIANGVTGIMNEVNETLDHITESISNFNEERRRTEPMRVEIAILEEKIRLNEKNIDLLKLYIYKKDAVIKSLYEGDESKFEAKLQKLNEDILSCEDMASINKKIADLKNQLI